MESKYSPEIQTEINHLLDSIQVYSSYFSINVEYYIDGFALFLDEKSISPRRIVIFKSYINDSFSIKSFEINLKNSQKEETKELYSIVNLDTLEIVIKELKEIIYGKDIMKYTTEKYFNKVLK